MLNIYFINIVAFVLTAIQPFLKETFIQDICYTFGKFDSKQKKGLIYIQFESVFHTIQNHRISWKRTMGKKNFVLFFEP